MPEIGSEKLSHREDVDPEKTQETKLPQGPWPHLKSPPNPLASSECLFSPTWDLTRSGSWYRAPIPQEHTEAWPAYLAFLDCQSSCSGKNIFFSLYVGSLGVVMARRECLITEGAGNTGDGTPGPLKGVG